MTDHQPYDVDPTDRNAVTRLRSAARRGDKRAEATIAELDQQAHTDRWDAAEQARRGRAEQRANRTRPSSVESVMGKLKQEREAKAARAAENRARMDRERSDRAEPLIDHRPQ